MAFKVGITEPGDFSGKALERLRSVGTVQLYDCAQQELPEFIEDKDILFVRLKYYWGEELLAAAGKLRHLCSPTTGLTHIDMDAVSRREIVVVSLRGETEFLRTISATAEHTFGLALALLRRYGQAFLRPGSADWERDNFKGVELKGMRAGIIGLGRVGTMLSGYLTAFGARSGYYDIREDADNPHGAERTDSLVSLIDSSDIIFLCASYENGNRHMIDGRLLERMKGKYFVNTARGELMDEETLLPLIQRNHFAGVALDVLDGEPGSTKVSEFAALTDGHNLIITPHIAGATYTSMQATEEFIVAKLMETVER